VAIVEKMHDAALKRDPLLLTVDGKSVKSVPDAWLHLRVAGTDRTFWIEADRGSEDEEAVFRRKIRKIVLAAGGKAQAKWGGTGFRVLFIVQPLEARRTDRRMAQILAWIEKELQAQSLEHFGGLFLIASIDPASVSGQALFTAPYFVSPFERTPRAVVQASA